MYWENEVETMSRNELEESQLARLKNSLVRASVSPHYSRIFKEHAVDPDSINSLDDVRRIPFTTKDDLRENWPYGFLAVPKEELARMHSSSGTTGRATVIFHTQQDIDAWTNILISSRMPSIMGFSPAVSGFITGRRRWAHSSSPSGPATANGRFSSCGISIPRSSISSPATPFT